MRINYPPDRFDILPESLERVGAHRSPRKKGRGFFALALGIVTTLILVIIGVLILNTVNSKLVPASKNQANVSTKSSDKAAAQKTDKPKASEKPTPTKAPVVAKVDPTIPVNVQNGTATAGLAAAASAILKSKGWNVAAVGNAATTDKTATVVYFADAAHEGAALGVAQSLPNAVTQLSQEFVQVSPLVVILGTNYAPPAG